MYYVEMLRVLRGLKAFAIVLGVLFLIMVALRVSLNKQLDPEKYIRTSPTEVRSVRVENDGSKTTIIDDRTKGTHVEIHQGLGVSRITITEKSNLASHKRPGAHGRGDHVNSTMGASVSEEDVPGVGHVTTIEHNSTLSLDIVSLIAGFLAAFMATVFGNALSKENEHLELAWTKPVSREKYALTTIGMDVGGIVASFVLAFCAIVAITSLFGIPHFVTSVQTPMMVVFSLLFPVSWYAVMQGMTASLRRASGLVLGLSWPVAFALSGLAQLKWNLQPVLQFLNTFNPVAYFVHDTTGGATSAAAATFIYSSTTTTDVAMLLALTLLGLTVAVAQWRRVEA